MEIKRILSLSFAFIGIFLAISSLTIFQTITGNVIGSSSNYRIIGVLGILFMIIAVVIEKYEFKKGRCSCN